MAKSPIPATLDGILSECSKIEESWDFIMAALARVEYLERSVLELEIQILGATASIKDTHQKIKKVSNRLETIDKFYLPQRDINSLYNHIKEILNSSQLMEMEVGRLTMLPGNIRGNANGVISYINEDGMLVNFSIREYIEPISRVLDKIMGMFSKFAILKDFRREFSPPEEVKEKNDEERIEGLESATAKIKEENTKKESQIERLEKDMRELLSNKDTAKQQSAKKLKELEEIIKKANNLKIKSEEKLEEIEEVRKKVERERGKVTTLDTTKTLYDKKKASSDSLMAATILYILALLAFLVCSFTLVFGDSEWVAKLPPINDFVEYIVARVLLSSPILLFIFLAAKYYNRAFRRSEYYASKYIIASFIEGFKGQAEIPEYKDAIASTVFSELLLDPADYIDRAEKRKKEKESVIASLIDKIKGKATEDIDIKAELEKLVGEIEKLKATKDGTPPTG